MCLLLSDFLCPLWDVIWWSPLGGGLGWFGFFKISRIIHPTKKRNEQYSRTLWMTFKLPSVLASLSFHDDLSSPLVSLVLKWVEGYFPFPFKCLIQYSFQWFSLLPQNSCTMLYSCTSLQEQIYISLINSPFNDFCWFPVFVVSLLSSLLSQSRSGLSLVSTITATQAPGYSLHL